MALVALLRPGPARAEPEVPKAAWAFGGEVLAGVGNRGAGGGLALTATRWHLRDTGVGSRVWTLGEGWPDQRWAGGLDVLAVVGDATGFVEVHGGVAGLSERRLACLACAVETRGPLIDASLGGAIGHRFDWASGRRSGVGAIALRCRSLPGRGYSAGVSVSFEQWTRGVE